jgi:hypothetical protein
MRYATFKDIPNEGALNACWKRAGEARRKWQDEGVLSLTPDEVADITLMSESDGEKIRAEAAEARKKAAAPAQPAATAKARQLREFYAPKENDGEGFGYFAQILRHPKNAYMKLMAGDLAEVLDALDFHLKAIYTRDTVRNKRLDDLELRMAAVDGQPAHAKRLLKDLTYERARELNAIVIEDQ